MSGEIKTINGNLYTADEIYELITSLDKPTLFTRMIENWPASKWSLEEFTSLFGNVISTFKIYLKKENGTEKNIRKRKCEDVSLVARKYEDVSLVAMETDCFYVTASFKEFYNWLHGGEDCGKLKEHPCDDYWCYCDYKYMAEMFGDNTEILESVDWSKFGLPKRNGQDSTIWIGSTGSFTPCHQDTYGYNLVAQITGVKKWTLVPPSDTDILRPTRIPYEESSVFSLCDTKSEKFKGERFEINLQPGQVLFVPKHWWHFVENITTGISINTWIEHESDQHDRLRESLVSTLVYSMKSCDESPCHEWLNPTQVLPTSIHSCLQQVNLALQDRMFGDNSNVSVDKFGDNSNITVDKLFQNSDFLINCFTDNKVLDTVIEVAFKKLKADYSVPLNVMETAPNCG